MQILKAHSKIYKWIVVLWLCAVLFSPLVVTAEYGNPAEYRVKAAFIYNFAKFVEWPSTMFDQLDTPVVIGILGQDIFGNAIETIANKIVKGRPLLIKKYHNIENIKGCHILFISSSEEKNIQKILFSVKDMPILTVSDMVNFVRDGGMIQFFMEGKKFGLESPCQL